MQFITEWVTNIILFILLATMVDLLLPNSTFQKYAKMVAGLLLISVILSPVFKLMTNDFDHVMSAAVWKTPAEKNIKNSMEFQKKEIQASLDEYTLNKMAVQMKAEANKELMEKYGVEIDNVHIALDPNNTKSFPENLDKLVISLKKSKESQNAVEVVESVDINTQQSLPSNKEQVQVDTKDITSFLADKWDVESNHINILVEGGEDNANG
ncbi:stage III sporulation protein AF [Niallia sp. 03133]|uniref:stage III sporulation protein AF n=1 Tax=Niallia sp. 03133 TaxID=3458060 RepID=UPI0040447952